MIKIDQSSLHKLYIKFLLGFSFILVLIWFRSLNLFSGAEERMPFYDPTRYFDSINTVWSDLFLGTPSLIEPSRIPYFYIIKSLYILKIPPLLLQMLTFFMFLSTGSLSIYLFFRSFFSRLNQATNAAFIAALFYLLNPFVISQVWGRGLYMHMFAYAFFPLFLLLFHLSIRKQNIYYILVAILSSFIFSSAVSNPALAMALWVLISIYFLCHLITSNRTRKSIALAIGYFVITLVSWIIVNLWWIAILGEQAASTYLAIGSVFDKSVESLKSVSSQNSLSAVLRLYHNGHFESSLYGGIYRNFFFVILSWIIPIVCLFSIPFFKKNTEFVFFIVLFLVSLFICLGSNEPSGFVFLYLFEKFPQLQVFRNPYEKMGIVFLISFTPFFAFGFIKILQLFKYFRSRYVQLLLSIILFTSFFLVFNFPMLTGQVIDWGVDASVPKEYRLLKQQIHQISGGDTGVLLFLPVISDLGAFYKWNGHQYHGDDPLIHIFDSPVITNTGKSQFLNNFKSYLGRYDLSNILSAMRVKFIISRQDIVAPRRDFEQASLLTAKYYSSDKEAPVTLCTKKLEPQTSVLLCEIPSQYMNWSNIHYLSIPLRVSNEATIEVILEDEYGAQPRWKSELEKNKIKPLFIPLINPSENPDTDFSRIKKILIKALPSDQVKINFYQGIQLFKGTENEVVNIKKIAETANFSIFQNQVEPVPDLVVVSKVELIDDFNQLFEKSHKTDFTQTAWLIKSQNLSHDFQFINQSNLATHYVDKLNETFYILKSDEIKPKLVVLNKSFDSGWKVVSTNEDFGRLTYFKKLRLLTMKSLPESEHFLANGYANLWISDGLNQKQIIFYRPQLIMEVSLQISLLFFCIISAILLLKLVHSKL